MPLPSKDKIVGFDFEKNVVLIKTEKCIRNQNDEWIPVHELMPLGPEEKEVMLDAWLDWRHKNLHE